MVLAKPMRNGSLGLALPQGAAEARPALGELDRIAGHVRVFWCAVVPLGGRCSESLPPVVCLAWRRAVAPPPRAG